MDHYKRGAKLYDEGRLQEAVEQYRLALTGGPDDVDIYTRIGDCLSELGRSDEALAAYRQGLTVDPDNTV